MSAHYLNGLNPAQMRAVQQTEGPVLVLAGAGSGKTRVITCRIAYLLSEGLAEPEAILAVTFTNKAAQEMGERVAELVGAKLAKRLTISTFHSFCLKVLREHATHLGYRKNFTIAGDCDARTLVRRVLENLDEVEECFSPDVFLEEIGLLKSANLGPDDVEALALTGDAVRDKYRTWLPAIYDQYYSAMRAANSMDFDDILLLTRRLWKEQAAVAKAYQQRFQYVMVDEYQDTNRIQYEIVRSLVEVHRNLCVVGDDDQSIYGWRGASIENILGFERDYPDATVVTLDQNYRSTKTILEAANAVVANNRERRVKKLWSDLGEGRKIDWLVTADEEHEAYMAVKWLKLIQARSDAKYSDFAVLYRSNLQSRPYELALRQAEIPYVVIGGQEFFDRAEVRDIIAYLRILVNPRDETAFLRVVNVPRRGIGDKTLHQIHDICISQGCSFGQAVANLLKEGSAPRQAEQGLRTFLGLLSTFRERFRTRQGSLAEVARELIDAVAYKEEVLRVCKTPEQAQMRWQNVEAVVKAIEEYEAHRKEEKKPVSLSNFLDSSSLNSDSDRMSRKDRQKKGVTLMTIHCAKGLEYPFVFIAGVEEGLMPHERSLKEGTLEEERRLFYVALTRGMRHVTLFEALSRQKYGKERMTTTSRFVKEIPEALLQQNILAARDMIEARVAPNETGQTQKTARRKKKASRKKAPPKRQAQP